MNDQYPQLMRTIDDTSFFIIFSEFESYESIEVIGKVIEQTFQAEIIEKLDGPDCRIWKLVIDGVEIQLINDDPYGNFLKATNEFSRKKLIELLPKLSLIFK